MNKTCLVNQANPTHKFYKFLDYFIKIPNLENNTRKNIMKNYLLLFLFAISLTSCTNNAAPENIASKIESSSAEGVKHNLDYVGEIDSTEWDWGIYYVIVSDTGNDYKALQTKMFDLSNNTKAPIDTMDRSFDYKKMKIVLPDDAEDEIYAGDYYPRRYDSDFLSIEYLNFYTEKVNENTMALIAGIFSEKSQLDSAFSSISKYDKNAFVMRSKIYIGCMH